MLFGQNMIGCDLYQFQVRLPSALPVGRTSMFCAFTGCLNDKMKGFYRSKYTTPAGEER